MKKLLIISCFAISSLMQANMYPKIGFEPYPNYCFVETGTYMGSGIQFALRAGFPEIHSIEINPQFVARARSVFAPHKQVHIHQGDSGKMLYQVIKDINYPITFWLDGHHGTPDPKGGNNTPLLEELDQIKMHPIKNHTIIIDDMHCCGTILFDYLTREDIIAKIKEINPAYHISYIPGGDDGEYPDNIMIAQIR